MPATIQKILKPTKYRAVDTSGNNNHGQIYSGRALEFDGVSDYLTGPTISEGLDYLSRGKNFTVSFWINVVTFADAGLWGAAQSGADRVGLTIGVNKNISFTDWDDSAYTHASTTQSLEANTWYRIVCTMEPTGTKKLYVNGILQTGTTTSNSDALAAISTQLYIGKTGSADLLSSSYLMSDFQVWNSTWTQSDVTYDYLNPESLALSNGGTSLTESNLKLWYPMQDGHRGQQSYILDGANTGLGPNLISNGDFETSGSWQSSNTELGGSSTSGITIPDNSVGLPNSDETIKYTTDKSYIGSRSMYVNTVPNGNEGLRQSFYATEGITYKFSAWFWCADGKQALITNPNGNFQDNYVVKTSNSIDSEWQYVEMYATCDSSGTSYIYIWADNGTNEGEFYVDDVKVQAVNDKHHATTVFLGDEMISAVNDRNSVFDEAGQWSAYNGTTVDVNSTVSGKMHITFEGDGTFQGAQLPVANFTTPVAGRIYRIEADLDYISGADTDIKIKFCIAGTNDATCIVSAVDGTPNDGGITTTEERYFSEVIATNSTGELLVVCKTAENDNASDPALITVDNVTVKEIGVASGWTDADQQLDIPQTALQSYNQLAWFDGKNDKIVSASFTPGAHTTVSFWVLDNFAHGTSHPYITAWSYSSGTGFRLIRGSTNKFVVARSHTSNDQESETGTTTMPVGEWVHCVAYIPESASNDVKIYINGELDSTHNVAQTMGLASEDITIGGGSGLGNNYFQGCITEIAIYTDELTLAEVKELYNDGKAKDATLVGDNLVRYYKNNGLATWVDEGSAGVNCTSAGDMAETLLLPAGVDASRDTQGFLMNRQKDTNSLNLPFVETSAEGNYASVPGFNFHSTTMSLSFWIKTPSYDTDNTILDKYETSGNLRALRLHLTSNDELLLQLSSDGTNYESQVTTNLDLAKNTWYHIAITFSSGTWLVYKNTSAVSLDAAAFSTETSIEQNRTNLKIGNAIHTSKEPWDGQIDDLCIYNDVLSSDEVDRNYKAGKRSHK